MNLLNQSTQPNNSLLSTSLIEPKARPQRERRIIWLASIAGAVLILVVYLIVPPAHQNSSVLLTVLGGGGALAFYLHRRHAEDARLVKELLKEFNERYDNLGTDLQFAVSRNGNFEKETELKFVRYFNLCAEEWLFWRAGYIYDPVWQAWQNGMRQYSKDKRVMSLWDAEAKSESYYGFDFRGITGG